MKKLIVILFITLPLLVACSNSTTSVQEIVFPGQSKYTIGEVLNDRVICSDTSWSEEDTSHGAVIVTYQCDYKGVSDYYAEKNIEVAGAQEFHQWVINDEGSFYDGGGIIFSGANGKSAYHEITRDWELESMLDVAYNNEVEVYADLFFRGTHVPASMIVSALLKRS